MGENLNDSPQIKELNEISTDHMILDIGPKTIGMIKKVKHGHYIKSGMKILRNVE